MIYRGESHAVLWPWIYQGGSYCNTVRLTMYFFHLVQEVAEKRPFVSIFIVVDAMLVGTGVQLELGTFDKG